MGNYFNFREETVFIWNLLRTYARLIFPGMVMVVIECSESFSTLGATVRLLSTVGPFVIPQALASSKTLITFRTFVRSLTSMHD